MKTQLFSFLFICFLPASLKAQDSIKVYFFLAEDCPICQFYAPEMRRLHDSLTEQGIAFRGVFPVQISSSKSIRAFQTAYQLPFPLIKDVNQFLTQKYHVRVTPEVIVTQNDTVVYQGRIDNRFDRPGRQRRHVTEYNLQDALAALLAGDRISKPQTQPIGCFITLQSTQP